MKKENGNHLFDRSEEYDAMLNEGLRISGENKSYFAKGRIEAIVNNLPACKPHRIVDFGCGIGDTTLLLSNYYGGANLIGIDTSKDAINRANRLYGSERISFLALDDYEADSSVDLVYVNGVFHHIDPGIRRESMSLICRILAPGGHVALFDNNPWSLPARIVMSRIPFDKDAVMISAAETTRLFLTSGIDKICTRYLFFFPAFLSVLRRLEPALTRFPLGAQYLVLGRKAN